VTKAAKDMGLIKPKDLPMPPDQPTPAANSGRVPFKRFGYRYHWRSWFGGIDRDNWSTVWFRKEAHRDQALAYQIQQKEMWEKREAELLAKNPNHKVWPYSHQDMEKIDR
jgi:hypothetical protein